MNCAMPVVTPNTKHQVRPRLPVGLCLHSATVRHAANDELPRSVARVDTIDPMLLVHQERARTFHLAVAALRDGLRMLRRSFLSKSTPFERSPG